MIPSRYEPTAGLFADRVILVTGSSRGVGQAVATAIAALGGSVILHGRDQSRLEQVYDAIEQAGHPQPAAIPLDLAGASTRQFDDIARQIHETFGRLDGVVHCAARVHRLMAVDAVSAETWQELFRVNVVAPLALTRACLPLLQQSPDAAVVYTLEEHVMAPDAYWGPVAVPQSALRTALIAQAAEWSTFANLRVNAVIPGPVASPSRLVTHPGHPRDAWPPLETLTPVYAYAVGPASRGVTGQVLRAQV
ncbi:MAG: SDR family NAD(P)-dependent oxidoreductase [Burkholderiales bacterium]